MTLAPPGAGPIGSVFDMFKDGADPEEISMSDVLCDFCGNEWKEEVPMIEGHQGSCICGKCLKMAWQQVVINRMNDTHEDWPVGCASRSAMSRVTDHLSRRPPTSADDASGWVHMHCRARIPSHGTCRDAAIETSRTGERFIHESTRTRVIPWNGRPSRVNLRSKFVPTISRSPADGGGENSVLANRC